MKHKLLLGLTLAVAIITVTVTRQFSKIAVADTTGNLLPIADGTNRQWTTNDNASSTTPHYTYVDESLCNGTTDFVYTNNTNTRDSYLLNLSSIPDGSYISSISITPCASVNTATTSTAPSSTIVVFYKYNGNSEIQSFPYSLTNSNNTPNLLPASSFNSLALPKSTTTSLEIGARYVNGTLGARLGQIITNITFSATSTTSTTPTSTIHTVTTTLANSITQTSAILWGAANPNGFTSTGWFRYSVTPSTCNDNFGIRAPLSGGTALGSGNTQVIYNTSIFGLSPNTTYYYCAIANNNNGTGFGTLKWFTTASSTPLLPPTVTTTPAVTTTQTASTLTGSAKPNGFATTGWFRYATSPGPGACNDSFGSRAPASGSISLGSGNSFIPFSYRVVGLNPGTVYYYCAIANSSQGTSFGLLRTFRTLPSLFSK